MSASSPFSSNQSYTPPRCDRCQLRLTVWCWCALGRPQPGAVQRGPQGGVGGTQAARRTSAPGMTGSGVSASSTSRMRRR